MRIFVTGASGFIGSAIVQELTEAGYQVLALARSQAAADSLSAKGLEVHRGDLENLESLRGGAAACDGVIHAAFIHEFDKYVANCETDRNAIAALGSALVGSERPLIVTSGTTVVSSEGLATEDAVPDFPATQPRAATEEAAAALTAQGARVSVVRLPPSVHGTGDHGFVPMLIDIAREKGVSAFIGEGLNHWPAVHRLDAAKLYRLVWEKNSEGARYHAVAEQGVKFKDIAEVIGRRLNLPVVGLTPAEGEAHFGWLAAFVGSDCPVSSRRTQDLLNWIPSQPGLLRDIDTDSYFPT